MPKCYAVLLSAGGSAFFAAHQIAATDSLPFIVTDRDCEAETTAAAHHLPLLRIPFQSRPQFSSDVSRVLIERKISDVLILFTRLVGPELFNAVRCVNVHPSLLPAYPGFGALAAVARDKASEIGATLHDVDASIDNGHRILQVSARVKSYEMAWLKRMSFLQKTHMCLWAIHIFNGGEIPDTRLRLIDGPVRYQTPYFDFLTKHPLP